jgi:hypothetical protein
LRVTGIKRFQVSGVRFQARIGFRCQVLSGFRSEGSELQNLAAFGGFAILDSGLKSFILEELLRL